MERKYYKNSGKSFGVTVDIASAYFFNLLHRFLYLLFLFFSLLLFIISKNSYIVDREIRSISFVLSYPVVELFKLPIKVTSSVAGYVKEISFAIKRNKRLEKENEILRNLYVISQNIKDENNNLKKALNYVNEGFMYKFKSGKILYKSSGSLTEKLLINLGSDNGIQEGFVVLSENMNIIGRVINVNKNTSDILLLSDFNSRIPVVTDRGRAKAILVGKNSLQSTLEFFDKSSDIQKGDLVYTAGDGNVIPAGLFVGRVEHVGKKLITVKLNRNVKKVNTVLIVIKE